MGPALSGLKKLVRLPVGCGEQNMVLFAPNIFVMDYLTAMDKITEEIKEECLSNMKTGEESKIVFFPICSNINFCFLLLYSFKCCGNSDQLSKC